MMTAPAWAQTATGTITGTITDTSGAAVAGAKAQITNTGTNVKVLATSNIEGNYTAPLLPPGA